MGYTISTGMTMRGVKNVHENFLGLDKRHTFYKIKNQSNEQESNWFHGSQTEAQDDYDNKYGFDDESTLLCIWNNARFIYCYTDLDIHQLCPCCDKKIGCHSVREALKCQLIDRKTYNTIVDEYEIWGN